MDGGDPFLPQEIITNILIRLPVKSLIRFQCVCKHWKNLFKTSLFIAEHLDHSSRQNPCLLFEDEDECGHLRIRLLDLELQVHEFKNEPFIGSVQRSWIVYSCNGLLCVIGITHILLWNPVTRDVRQVPKAINWLDSDDFYLGFGFSPIVNDYKIVKIRVSGNDDLVNQVEVYSLDIGSWKEVEFGNLDGVAIFSDGFSFKGAIFWIGSKLDAEEDGYDIDIIVSFDIATEVFTLIPMPPSPFSVTNTSYLKHLTVYENKLAMLSHTLSEDFKSSLIHLWVMEEGTCASTERWGWTKKYSSSPYLGCLLIPMTTWRSEIVCNIDILPGPIDQIEDEDERKTIMFNFITNKFKTFDIRKFAIGHGIFNYAESLVRV